MLSETLASPETRYLQSDEYFSGDGLKSLRAACIHQGNRKNDDAYKRFINWTNPANELLVYTIYAYADLVVPHQFDCIFRLANPREYELISYKLTQSILNLGGLRPISTLEHGHKHFCVLTFDQEVPTIFGRLHQEDGTYHTPLANREQLGFCMAHDLSAITERLEKVAQLRSQYGNEWWKYDELST